MKLNGLKENPYFNESVPKDTQIRMKVLNLRNDSKDLFKTLTRYAW